MFNSLFSVILLVVVNIWAFFQPSEEDLLAKEKAKQEQAQAQLLQQEIDDKKQKEKKVYEEKFSEFKNQEGQQIQSAITDLELLEEGLAERINSLELLIKEAGREPNEDADLNQWKDHLSKVQMNLKNLEESLKDAFLQYQKFKLTATAGEQKAFEQAIETGSADAQEIVGRYDELKQQLSGEKEED